MPVLETEFKYNLLFTRSDGSCDLKIYRPHPGMYVVMYSQPEEDYCGPSVTNGAEYLASSVMEMPFMERIPVGKVLWVEHYPAMMKRRIEGMKGETFDLVLFSWKQIPNGDRRAYDPAWHRVDREWVERLILESLDPSLPDAPPDVCPICGGDLLPDVEYMQDKFGPDWRDLPWPDWSFCCESCGEAGPWAELEDIAKYGYGEKP